MNDNPRIVIDTNVLVSAVLKSGSAPHRVVAAVLKGRAALVPSDWLRREYSEVLARPEFGFDPDLVAALLDGLRARALEVEPASVDVCGDPDDNLVLGTAVAGNASFLVTGNRKHFPPSHEGVKVVSPAEFLPVVANACQ